jgi:hypothetical protein
MFVYLTFGREISLVVPQIEKVDAGDNGVRMSQGRTQVSSQTFPKSIFCSETSGSPLEHSSGVVRSLFQASGYL